MIWQVSDQNIQCPNGKYHRHFSYTISMLLASWGVLTQYNVKSQSSSSFIWVWRIPFITLIQPAVYEFIPVFAPNQNSHTVRSSSCLYLSEWTRTRIKIALQILHTHCFCFLLGPLLVPREIGNNAYRKFAGTNKEYFGILRSFLLCNTSYNVSLFSNHSPHTISFHLPFVCINQVSGTEVTRKAMGVHADIKRRSKSFHPKAILQGSWIGTQVFNVMLKMTVCAV